MKEADAKITKHFIELFDEGKRLGLVDSKVANDPSQAHYRDRDARCYNCENFEDPSICKVGVNDGTVEPEGGCDLFSMADDTDDVATGTRSTMSAEAIARTFYLQMVSEEVDRISPTDFDLPASIESDFRLASEVYLEASLLFVLRSYALKRKDYERVLRVYEGLIFPEAPDSDRETYVKLVLEAMRDLQGLFDPKNTGRDGNFAYNWLARIGHLELNSITLFSIADYWMSTPIIMSKTIQKMASDVVVM